MSVLLGIAFKSLLIAGLTLALLELMKRRSAAERSWVAHSGLFALVVMAVAPLALPSWNVEGPALLGSASPVEATAPASASVTLPAPSATPVRTKSLTAPQPIAPAIAATSNAPKLGAAATTMVLYAVPAAILLFITFLALARLVTLQARADVLVDAHWLSALARAQRRMGFKHGTALLTSDELASPISWGVIRPVILLNTRAVEASGEAEAIIAHELAHVARMDWIKLLLARVATALFWFNPLVWLLARESHQLREEAADDAVLEANIPDTDYAQLLVGVARHECPGLLLGAHGVAPSKSSLARRVARVLDGKIMRGPVGGSFAAGVFVGAVIIAAPLAALTLVPSGSKSDSRQMAAISMKKDVSGAYYPVTAPTDLPSIIGAGVATSVQSAVAAINPTVRINGDDAGDDRGADFEAIAPSGATVRRVNGITVSRAPNGATVTVYPPDANGRRKVVARSVNGALVTTYAEADQMPGGAAGMSAPRQRIVENRHDSVIDSAIAMKAVGVTPEYIQAIRAAAPQLGNLDADDLVELKSVGVTPAYIRDLASAGFTHLDQSSLTDAAALHINGSYIRELAGVGYRNLTMEQYTDLKAVGVTGAYIRQLQQTGYGPFSVDKLVEMRALGVDLEDLRRPPAPPRPPRVRTDSGG
ncbi:MAG: M56 family metallopeptidase [Sphingomicrobium sp.]